MLSKVVMRLSVKENRLRVFFPKRGNQVKKWQWFKTNDAYIKMQKACFNRK